MKHSRIVMFTLLLLTLTVSGHASPPSVKLRPLSPSGGLQVSVDPASGRYTVVSKLPAWSFSGSVGAELTDIVTSQGADLVGQYQQVSFDWNQTNSYKGVVRTYTGKQIARFFITSIDQTSGPTPDFPAFTDFPAGLHHLSYTDERFSPPKFTLTKTSTPWFLFDDNANTAALSPSSNFIVSQMHGDGVALIGSGLIPTIAVVPAGFTHESVFTVGHGIESTIQLWGNTLTRISGKSRPSDDSDPVLKYFGYWTDHGANYYYNYDLDKGYAGTLLSVKGEYDKDKIPLHYLQLDSWWYQKSKAGPDGKVGSTVNTKLPEGTWNAYGGTLDYSASPALFPNGLDVFYHQLDLPLIVHGRWIDPGSPYHALYKISGVAPVDPHYWDDRAKYLADRGVICYEQDWLSIIYPYSPEMATNLDTGDAFTDNMARATKANNETLQYCMATPRFFLQGSKYDNLTTIRTSDDRFIRPRWNDFIYVSAFADALNIRPWTDTFMSAELTNLLIATLSTGPVGVGDKIGTESGPNILKSIRADGVIVRPDVPLLPTDSTVINDANKAHLPLIASTYTDNGLRTAYVFAFTRQGDSSNVSFTPSSLGFTGSVYVTSYAGVSKKQDAAAPFTDTLDSDGWNYYTVAPVGKSGIAFLGDADKFVGTGRAVIQSIADEPGKLKVTINNAESVESPIILHGFSANAPTVSVNRGTAEPVTYDPSTEEFTVSITVPKAAISSPSRQANVPTNVVTFSSK